jgi:hypothetical protein
MNLSTNWRSFWMSISLLGLFGSSLLFCWSITTFFFPTSPFLVCYFSFAGGLLCCWLITKRIIQRQKEQIQELSEEILKNVTHETKTSEIVWKDFALTVCQTLCTFTDSVIDVQIFSKDPSLFNGIGSAFGARLTEFDKGEVVFSKYPSIALEQEENILHVYLYPLKSSKT